MALLGWQDLPKLLSSLENMMSNTKPFPDPSTVRPLMNEADIGSGEKTPGQLETEEMIAEIAPLPESSSADADEGDEDMNDDDADGGAAAGAGR